MDDARPPLDCASCGARPDPSDPTGRCSFCNTPFPVERPAARTLSDARADRLRQIREAPQFGARHVSPSVSEFRNGFVGMGVFGAVFGAFALFFMFVAVGGIFRGSHGAGGIVALPFILIPGLFLVVGGTMVLKAVQSVRRLANAPLRTLPAIVIGKREQRTGKHGRQVTHFLTIETEHGRRVEVKAPSRIYGLAAIDDAGVAYMKDEFLLDFRRTDD